MAVDAMKDGAGYQGYSSAAHSKSFEAFSYAGDSLIITRDFLHNEYTACANGSLAHIDIERVLDECMRSLFNGIRMAEVRRAMAMAAASFIELDPAYDTLAAAVYRTYILERVYRVHGLDITNPASYRHAFIKDIEVGVAEGRLDARMLSYDLPRVAELLAPERDALFNYMGLFSLAERFLAKNAEREIIETPQAFWMRVAMGMSLLEENPYETIEQFYTIMSQFLYVPSTPTLFHAGHAHSQLSSCYLHTVEDDLHNIFETFSDQAVLAKWAGGIGGSWTNIRGTGALIKSTRANSLGVIPYLKISNDVVVAITRTGIRRGGFCAYLETWHLDIEEFLDLRRNTGDERRRTHDLNTANWIPDLFMKRVEQDGQWTLFSPDETPDLHGLYGLAFEERYCQYEALAAEGQISLFKTVSAVQLWRKMLTRLFETGHPWITFKDRCNIGSPQDHVGVVHSSNLCTEITLNTSKDEIAVCNLGSLNIAQHITAHGIDQEKLAKTIAVAVRMLDNVIDLNFYPVEKARRSNMRHRPIGLGMMGLQDALYMLKVPFASAEAVQFSKELMESVSYYAYSASADLAAERGAYETYAGSKWNRGILPQDTVSISENQRGVAIDVDRTEKKDWQALRAKIKAHGMRNSNVLAIAPTATISTLIGVIPSIEPIYRHLYVKANVSGEFTIINKYLVAELKQLGLWNEEMSSAIKYYDGSIAHVPHIPTDIKERYKTSFEIDPTWVIDAAAHRQVWIDQSQSINIWIAGASGKVLDKTYRYAWAKGLKTTYYLRTLGASQIEKSTLDAKKYGFTQKRTHLTGSHEAVADEVQKQEAARACSILNGEECESCQ